MSTDKANKLAISMHYFLPPPFTVESDKNPLTWIDDQSEVHENTSAIYSQYLHALLGS